MDETVFVIHQQQPHARVLFPPRSVKRLGLFLGIEGAEKSSGFSPTLTVLARRIGVVEQRGSRAIFSHTVAQVYGADGDPCVDVAVHADHPHGAAVPAARFFFQIFHRLSGPFLGVADDGHGPHVRQERVERIKPLGKRSFHVIDGMEQPRIGLDQPPPDHLHRSRHGDARLIIAVHVRAHR